jgi:hypothetical protein
VIPQIPIDECILDALIDHLMGLTGHIDEADHSGLQLATTPIGSRHEKVVVEPSAYLDELGDIEGHGGIELLSEPQRLLRTRKGKGSHFRHPALTGP